MPLVSHKKTVVSVIHRLVDYNDVDLDKRVWVREPEDPGIRGLQSTVQGAVTRLSEDLYSGEAGYRRKNSHRTPTFGEFQARKSSHFDGNVLRTMILS